MKPTRASGWRTILLGAALTLMGCPLLRADCSLTSTGVIPLNDLGPGSYQGFIGGLYPAGSDTPPAAHAAAALAIATDQIKPLNSSGNPDPVNGRIVMISIGMSNTTQEFATKGTQNFKLRAEADPAKNPQLVIVDGAQGGQDAPAWINPSAPTWNTVNQRLAAAGVSPQQVQVAWLKQALAGPLNYGAFPAHAQALQTDLEIIVRNLKTNFPNIRITYLSPRSRAYTNIPTALNPEPFAYETGFAVKWTVGDQIAGAGNLNFDPANGVVVAPLILWGPYIWADGLTPRSDGFIWVCPDLEADFTHPTAGGGVPKVGSHLLAFFKTDPTAAPWFLKRTVTGQPPQVTAGASVSSGPAPLSVNFTASAVDPDGTIIAYQWTFDDGTFSTAQNPAKTFPAPGNYSVHLTVTDDSGNTTLRTLPISVTPAGSSPTPTSTPTPPPPSPTPPPTPSPTLTPTITPTPTSPTPTPTSPTPSEPPIVTPTPTPSPTATATATVAPTPPPPTPTTTPGQCGYVFLNEKFDGVTAPALPPDWVSSFTPGPGNCTTAGTCTLGTNWTTSATAPSSPPNCAFHDAPSCVTDSSLYSPIFFVANSGSLLTFNHNYDLESGLDGAVLEISINNGPFIDFVAAGGSFFGNSGYNGTISSTTHSPIAGRAAWTGSSGGYRSGLANMPPVAAHQAVVLRFRLATDCSGASVGWRLDDIQVTLLVPCNTPTIPPQATPTPSPTPPTQALNLSTRLRVQTGDNAGIGGFIITGDAPKRLLFRGIGPSLTGLGITGTLANPTLDLRRPDGTRILANDNWRDTQEVEIQATGIPPTDNLEAAIVQTLDAGSYTVILRGMGMTTGIGLVEIYDLDQGVGSKLANMSTRAFAGTGDNIVIAGFLLGGSGGDTGIVVRGLGPSLTAAGVPNALADPTLELRDENGMLRAANNNWQDNPGQAAELMVAGLAPANQLESGIALVLPPGAYTALLAGLNNGTGVGLVEVYDRGELK